MATLNEVSGPLDATNGWDADYTWMPNNTFVVTDLTTNTSWSTSPNSPQTELTEQPGCYAPQTTSSSIAGDGRVLASDADNQITFGPTSQLHGCLRYGCRRLPSYVERHMSDSLLLELFKERFSPFGGPAGDNAGTFSNLGRQGCDFRDRAGAKYDARGGCKFKLHDFSRLPWNTAANPNLGRQGTH